MADPAPKEERDSSVLVKSIRYGLGAVMVIGGIVVLIVNPGGFGVDGFAMAVGGGLSVLMINWLFRLGVTGDLEREEEERARRYFDEHGHWPDEQPRVRRELPALRQPPPPPR
jgi:hypothetical protein